MSRTPGAISAPRRKDRDRLVQQQAAAVVLFFQIAARAGHPEHLDARLGHLIEKRGAAMGDHDIAALGPGGVPPLPDGALGLDPRWRAVEDLHLMATRGEGLGQGQKRLLDPAQGDGVRAAGIEGNRIVDQCDVHGASLYGKEHVMR
jgi:hypothetical protein